MKLSIEKQCGHIKIELTTDTSKKPLMLEIHESQLAGLLLAVEAVRKADKAKIIVEL